MIKELSPEQRDHLSRALGERTGWDIRPEEVEVIGSWIFYNCPDTDDVDVFRAPIPIEAEPWTGVAFNQSPFGTKDPDILGPMVDKLEREYDD